MSNVDAFLARAERTLGSAELLFRSQFFDDAVSRAYYAMFYAAEALLLSKQLAASTHKGVHNLVGDHFVKTGLLEPEYGRILNQAGDKRQVADYAHTFEITEADASTLLHDARTFVTRCRELLAH